MIVFGTNKELFEIYIAKEPKFELISVKNTILRLFLTIKANLNLFYFHSSHLNKKLYIKQLNPREITG